MYIHRTILGQVSLSDEDETVTFNVPRSAWYQKIHVYTVGDFTTGSSVNADAMKDFYTTVDLVANGSNHYLTASSRLLYEQNMRDYKTPLPVSTVAASQTDKTYTALHTLDFRFNYNNPYDISSAVPANKLGTLTLALTHSKMSTLIGSGASVSNAKAYITAERVIFDSPAEEAKHLKSLMAFSFSELNYNISATANSYGTNMIDVPTGRMIKNIMMATSVSGSYSDDLIDRMKLRQTSPYARDIYENYWRGAKNHDVIDNSLEVEHQSTGWANVDTTFISGYLNTMTLKQGDIKLDILNPSNTGEVKLGIRSYV